MVVDANDRSVIALFPMPIRFHHVPLRLQS